MLGIFRGLLYLVGTVITFVYSYLLVNAKNTANGGYFGGGNWHINAYMYFFGIEDYRELYSRDIDLESMERVFDFFGRFERTLGEKWATMVFVPGVIIILAVCAVLYLRSRSLRMMVAASEADA